MKNVKRVAVYGTVVAALSAVPAMGSANAAQNPPIACQGAAEVTITPNTLGGADYVIRHGGGHCLQGGPRNGDWSVRDIRGNGHTKTFNCVPGIGGTVSGLKMTMRIKFFNNKTNVTTYVVETWTQALPVDAMNSTKFTITPGGTPGMLVTRILNRCPGDGDSPSAQLIWDDTNPN
ncbi:MAG: hypothetical protein ACJ735_06955 [Actinomycetes bacterium]